MKKVFTLILEYFSVIFGSGILGILLYSLFDGSLRLVSGVPLEFNGSAVLKGLFLGLQVSLILSGMFLCCFEIRKPSVKLNVILTYACLGLFTWLVFFPLMVRCGQLVCGERGQNIQKETDLSSGYFRDYENKSLYFVTPETEDAATVIGVDTLEPAADTIVSGKIDLSPESGLVEQMQPFSDPLIKKSYEDVPFKILEVPEKIFIQAEYFMNHGFLGWLVFATLGFLLWSIFGFMFLSSWKLINIFIVIFLTFGFLFFNSIYYSDSLSFLHNIINVSGEISGSNLMLAIINAACGVIMIGAGVVLIVIHRRKSR